MEGVPTSIYCFVRHFLLDRCPPVERCSFLHAIWCSVDTSREPVTQRWEVAVPLCDGQHTALERKCCRPASATSRSLVAEPISHYASRPLFSDGHDRGIYSRDLPHSFRVNQQGIRERVDGMVRQLPGTLDLDEAKGQVSDRVFNSAIRQGISRRSCPLYGKPQRFWQG